MSLAKEIAWGSLPQEIEDSFEVMDGQLGELDSASIDFLVNYQDDIRIIMDDLGYTKNLRVVNAPVSTYGWFFVLSYKVKRQGCFALVSVDMIGQSAVTSEAAWNQRRLREISAFGQMVSVGPIEKVIIVEEEQEGIDPDTGNPIVVKRRVPKVDALGEVEYKTIVTPSGSAERWNVNDPSISVTDTYFVLSQPATNVIGTAMTPPTPPTPPSYKWAGYNEPLRGNAPSGWVLDDRKISVIVPNRVWRVIDTFNFYQAAVPD